MNIRRLHPQKKIIVFIIIRTRRKSLTVLQVNHIKKIEEFRKEIQYIRFLRFTYDNPKRTYRVQLL